MPIDEFIITVFGWVDTELKQGTGGVKLRTRGCAPPLSDSAVITMELGGEWGGYAGDEAIWAYFKQQGRAGLPGWGERTTCVRQAANLWRLTQFLPDRVVTALGARTADCHIIDGVPIAVCKLARAPRRRILTADADDGYCAAQTEYSYGLNANRLIDRRGVVVGMTITAAHLDERDSAYDLVSMIEGVLLGDKGFLRPQFKADCEARGIDRQTPLRQNMTEPRPRWWLQRLRRLRKRVETVLGQRQPRGGLAKTRARDVWHVTNQVTRQLLAHTLGVWLNLPQGREPLELDGLVIA